MGRHFIIGCGRFKFDLTDITVEPILFLYMFANFLYYPTIQALIFEKVCLKSFTSEFCESMFKNKTFKHNHTTQNHEISSETSLWILKLNLAMTLPAVFIVLLFLGVLGDKLGRKVPVLLPCIGAFSAGLSALLNAHYMTASLNYILIGPIINGFCGGVIACLMAVYSYIGHIAHSETKMKRIGIAEAMVFLAGTVGVFTSGVMLDNKGYIFVFSVCTIVNGVAFIYALFWLNNIRATSEARAVGYCRQLWKFLFESFQCIRRTRDQHTFTAILLQILVLDVLMLCTSGDFDISLLYLRDSLDFSQTLYGYLKGLDNFMRGIVLLTFLPLIKKCTTIKDMPLVLFGLISFAVGFIVVGVASKKWMVFLACFLGMFKGLPSAGLRSTMSSMVNKDEQGRLFGLIAASENLTMLVATVMFNELYPLTTSIYPGLCYLMGAGLIIIVFFFILYLYCTLPQRPADNDYASLNNENETVDT